MHLAIYDVPPDLFKGRKLVSETWPFRVVERPATGWVFETPEQRVDRAAQAAVEGRK